MASSATLDDELGVPTEASFPASESACLETNAGVTIELSAETCLRKGGRSLLVGRQAAVADIRIQHGSISRKHAVFYYINNSLYLKDMGGKHGTQVNQEHIEGAVRLKHGDSILFGNVRESIFQVQIEQSAVDEKEETNIKSEEARQIKDQEILEKAGEGLTGRAKHQAEIAAMMSSLEEAPSYQKYTPSAEEVIASSHEPSDNKVLKAATKYKLPITQTLVLNSESDRRTTATCLAIDPAGSRFAVGSMDTCLRFFDFGGMDRSRQESFKTVIPDEGHWLVDCCYSNTGDRLLVGTGGVQPIVLDRDGEEIIKFVRGDMYVSDKSKTMGHTAAVTSVDWHPLERDIVLTASSDGSARLWNLKGKTHFDMLVCDKVFQAKSERGQRTAVTSVCFHPGGREFALGTFCGSIQIWSRSRVSGRPERATFNAHGPSKPITSLMYNMDGSRLLSRSSADDTCKMWNAKRMSRSSQPVEMCTGLPTVHDCANAALSPDGNILCAGASELRKTEKERHEVGTLNFYKVGSGDSASVDPFLTLDIEKNIAPSVVKWHPKLNQIFVGCSDGRTLVYYDSKRSLKGALLPAGKAGRGVDDLSELLRSRAPKGSAAITGEIVTPFAQNSGRQVCKKRKLDERKDPVKSREPERPVSDKHKTGSQVGGNTSFAQFVADQTVAKAKVIAGKDPREALMQYSEGKSYLGKETKILAAKTAEEEEETRSKKP